MTAYGSGICGMPREKSLDLPPASDAPSWMMIGCLFSPWFRQSKSSATHPIRFLRQHIESYMGDKRRIAVKVIDERGNELMVVREPDA